MIYRLVDPETLRSMRSAAAATASRLRLLAGCVLSGDWRGAASQACTPIADANLIPLRNLVVAPVAEEFVFRGCMVPLLRLQVSRANLKRFCSL